MSNTDTKQYENIKVETVDENIAEITGDVKADVFNEYKGKALKNIQKDYEAKGFRKGKVPTDVIEKQLGEDRILNEAAQQVLNDIYPDLIQDNDLKVMSRPQVQITKIADGNPLGFKIKVGITPEIKLPKYKKLAKEAIKETKEEQGEIEIEDKEVEQVIKYIQSQHAVKDEENEDAAPKVPELNDEFVKKLGDFENVEDFKKKMKENLVQEKKKQRGQQAREKIAEKLTEETKINIPEITVETQLGSRFEQLQQSLSQRDMTFEEYLEKIEKDQEEFIKEEKENVKNQIKTRLILEAIAKKEDIEPDKEQVAKQVKAMQQHNPDADVQSLTHYIQTAMVNRKVLDMLEGKEEEKEKSKEEEK